VGDSSVPSDMPFRERPPVTAPEGTVTAPEGAVTAPEGAVTALDGTASQQRLLLALCAIPVHASRCDE